MAASALDTKWPPAGPGEAMEVSRTGGHKATMGGQGFFVAYRQPSLSRWRLSLPAQS